MLSYFLGTRCCWRSQSRCWSCLHVAVLKLDVAGQDAGQLGVVSVVVEEFLLNNGLPYYVDLVGFSHDCWDVEMTTDVLKRVLADHVAEDSYLESCEDSVRRCC